MEESRENEISNRVLQGLFRSNKNWIAGILIVWISSPLMAYLFILLGRSVYSLGIPKAPFLNWNMLGTVGDSFGIVNAFFSGTALILVIIATILQSHELSLQRKALEEQRAELKKQALEMSTQNALTRLTFIQDELDKQIESRYKYFGYPLLQDAEHYELREKASIGTLVRILFRDLIFNSKPGEGESFEDYQNYLRDTLTQHYYLKSYTQYLLSIFQTAETVCSSYEELGLPEISQSIKIKVKTSFSTEELALIQSFILIDEDDKNLGYYKDFFDLYISTTGFAKVSVKNKGKQDTEPHFVWDEEMVKAMFLG